MEPQAPAPPSEWQPSSGSATETTTDPPRTQKNVTNLDDSLQTSSTSVDLAQHDKEQVDGDATSEGPTDQTSHNDTGRQKRRPPPLQPKGNPGGREKDAGSGVPLKSPGRKEGDMDVPTTQVDGRPCGEEQRETRAHAPPIRQRRPSSQPKDRAPEQGKGETQDAAPKSPRRKKGNADTTAVGTDRKWISEGQIETNARSHADEKQRYERREELDATPKSPRRVGDGAGRQQPSGPPNGTGGGGQMTRAPSMQRTNSDNAPDVMMRFLPSVGKQNGILQSGILQTEVKIKPQGQQK